VPDSADAPPLQPAAAVPNRNAMPINAAMPREGFFLIGFPEVGGLQCRLEHLLCEGAAKLGEPFGIQQIQ
jgi:hypothetical protein